MATWPIGIKVILFLHLFAFGAFCVYGMTGLTFKEENTPKIRKIAAYACGFAVIAFLIFLAKGWLEDPTRDEDFKEKLKESYEEGYDNGYYDAYDEWYPEGYNDGYDDGLESGYEQGLEDASL
jgi:hypothetical protein